MTRDVVVRVDLTETSFANSKEVTAYIREQATSSQAVNATRMLAVASDLSGGIELKSLQAISTCKLTQRVFIVLVDERDEAPTVLEVSDIVNRNSMRLLWVQDRIGIVWAFNGDVLLPGADDDDHCLEQALEVLGDPRVFDEVWDRIDESSVNSLGFKMTALPAADLDDLIQCEQRAALALRGTATDPMPELPRELERLTGNDKPPDDVLAAGSPIVRAAELIRRNRLIAHEATRRLRVMPLSSSSATEAVEAVEQAEAELADLRRAVHEISTTVDGSDGIDGEEAETLLRHGFNPRGSDELADIQRDAELALRDWLADSLPERGMTALRGRLDEMHRRLEPRDADSVSNEVDELCPEISDTRSHRERFRILMPLDAAALLVVGAAAAGFIRPRAYGIAMVTALALIGLIAQVVFRSSIIRQFPPFTHPSELLPWLLLPALGGLAVLLDVSLPYPAVLAVVAVMGLLAALASSWFSSIDAWTAQLYVNGDAELLLDRITSIGWNEWILAAPRLDLAEITSNVLVHLEQSEELLRKLLTEQPADAEVHIATGGPVLRGRANLAPMIQAVRAELAEAVIAGFDDIWRNLGAEEAGTATPFSERIKQEVTSIRTRIYRPLDSQDSDPQDRIARAHSQMQKELWEQFDAAIDLPTFSIGTEMRQFVSPDQKRSLSDSPHDVRLVRFLPADLAGETAVDAVRINKPIAGALRFIEFFETAVNLVPEASTGED